MPLIITISYLVAMVTEVIIELVNVMIISQ